MSDRGYVDSLLEIIQNEKDPRDGRLWKAIQYLLPLWAIVSTAFIALRMENLLSIWIKVVTILCSLLVFAFWCYRISKQVNILDTTERKLLYGASSTPTSWKVITPIIVGIVFGLIFGTIIYSFCLGSAVLISVIGKGK